MMIKNPAFAGSKASLNPEHHISERMIPVRCGSCEGCLKSNINNWSFRLEQEAKQSTYIHFVTLTYDPLYVPLTGSNLPTLSKKDVQLFLKRLRQIQSRDCGRDGIKHFAVGEYGTNTYRPHYHLLLFNVIDTEYIYKAWSKNHAPIGNIHIGNSISDGAIPYTLKYMYKKGLVPAFPEDDRLPEFRIMSKKLGINYLTPAVIKWHLTDFKNRQYVQFSNGIKVALPRYFRETLIKIWNKPRELLRNDQSVFMSEDNNDYRSLKSRVENQKIRQKLFDKTQNQNERKKI